VLPNLPEGHGTTGFAHWCRWEWAAAEQSFRRALELNPLYVQGRCWRAYFLAAIGRHAEALAEVERALDLDPVSHYAHMIAGEVFRYARRYDEAIASQRRALGIHPDFALAQLFLGVALTGAARYDVAEPVLDAALKGTGRSPLFVGCAGAARALAGRRQQAREMLDEYSVAA
jgi:tetratricopeptide (TPR) repeat protein